MPPTPSPPAPTHTSSPARRLTIRRATARDLAAILALEASAFQPWRRASPRSLRRSLASPRQSVWAIQQPGRRGALAAFLVLWHHRSHVRVYDIATHTDVRGQGYGLALMRHAEAIARKAGCRDVSLEADAADRPLVGWYLAQGYRVTETLSAFYEGGRAAVRLRKEV